jgi:hypothetical protein
MPDMRLVLRLIGAVVGLLVLAFVLYVAYEVLFGRPYTVELATSEQLTEKERAQLARIASLEAGEKIVFYHSESGLEKGGALLTDRRVVSYQGSVVQGGLLRDVTEVTMVDGSFLESSVITVTFKDGKQVLCEVTTAENSDKKFLTSLKNLAAPK